MNQLATADDIDSRRGPAPNVVRSSYATRHDRRRLETRARMLRALMKLLARKRLADVPIHEITETADVGGGTFYNHFTDRASIHDALTAELLVGWSDALAAAIPLRQDPAEMLGLRLRVGIQRAGLDADWANYLVATAFRPGMAGNPFDQRIAEAIETGVAQGRFTLTEIEATQRAILGLTTATLHSVSGDASKSAIEAVRVTRFTLTLLGVAGAEIERILALPLPYVTWEDNVLVRRAHAERLAEPEATA